MTKIGMKRDPQVKQKHLKRTPLRQVSKKQSLRNKTWSITKQIRIDYFEEKYGYKICEYCGANGVREMGLPNSLEAHHIDRNRLHNYAANCYINHSMCHAIITAGNIQVVQEDFQGRE